MALSLLLDRSTGGRCAGAGGGGGAARGRLQGDLRPLFPLGSAPDGSLFAIANAGKPLLLHSGILYNGKASSRFNRPAEFEALLTIPGLRFALAHIGWPWCDGTIALFGHYSALFRPRGAQASEMFIDLTCGTPPIYRHEALTKLCTVGFDVWDHLLFGTDSTAADDAGAT